MEGDLLLEQQQSLQTEYWSLEKLIPNAQNARTHSEEQVAQIAASITEFGFINPILIPRSRRERWAHRTT
jgi:ParB-like chromosome segregation protein Spo0J